VGDALAVTGASGFIGREVTRLAAGRGLAVKGLTRSDAGADVVARAGGQPLRLPGLERDALARAFAGASAVVHLAQIGSERGGQRYETVNVAGTRAVALAARDAGATRVIFFSGLGVARYGMSPRCTNAYFLSKLSAELELYRSDLSVAVFRPSYVVGPGTPLIADLARQLADGEVERVGDGRYRLQPIGVRDAASAILAAARHPFTGDRVWDLVGPEAIHFDDLVARVARARPGAPRVWRFREVPIEEAERQAAAGGYRGMPRDELDCLLCDEVGDARPLEALLERALTPLDDVLAAALRPA
jgi:nucleoside-diphosphate-sugar epimerase